LLEEPERRVAGLTHEWELVWYASGHVCPPYDESLGQWIIRTRYLWDLSTDKVAALKAVGVEFDGRKAQAIREQHEAPSEMPAGEYEVCGRLGAPGSVWSIVVL
jgi:hypothetical protein